MAAFAAFAQLLHLQASCDVSFFSLLDRTFQKLMICVHSFFSFSLHIELSFRRNIFFLSLRKKKKKKYHLRWINHNQISIDPLIICSVDVKILCQNSNLLEKKFSNTGFVQTNTEKPIRDSFKDYSTIFLE